MQMYYILALLVLHLSFTACQTAEEITLDASNQKPLVGGNSTLLCSGDVDRITWRHKKGNITSDGKHFQLEFPETESGVVSQLHLLNVQLEDSGKYKCLLWSLDEKQTTKSISIHVQAAPVLGNTTNSTVLVGSNVTLSCSVIAIPAPKVLWRKNETLLNDDIRFTIEEETTSPLSISTISFTNSTTEDVGTYSCTFENAHGTVVGIARLSMQDKPKVKWKNAQSIGPDELLLQWAVEDNHSPLVQTKILISREGTVKSLVTHSAKDSRRIVSLSKIGFGPQDSKLVDVTIEVTNKIGTAKSPNVEVDLLSESPLYVPKLALKGSSKDSLSVDWTGPSEVQKHYITYFELTLTSLEMPDKEIILKNANSSDHLFVGLQSGTTYDVTIVACMEIYGDKTQDCSAPSAAVSGGTMSAPPNAVRDVLVHCRSNRTSGRNTVDVQWSPAPSDVDKYKVQILSSANYIDANRRRATYRHSSHVLVHGNLTQHHFQHMQPNTNYTVRVYAGMGRVFSSSLSSNCEMPTWRPDKHNLRWWKFTHGPRTVLKMPTPNVSQRNGTICCHRVVVVKLDGNRTVTDLPRPPKIPVFSFTQIDSGETFGGYVAEAFSSNGVKSEYILIGDGQTVTNSTDACDRCLKGSSEGHDPAVSLPYTRALRVSQPVPPQDKPLSPDTNYTGFLILSVRDHNGTVLSSYSDYFNVMQPKEEPADLATPTLDSPHGYAVYVLASLIALLFLVTTALVFLLCHYQYRKKELLQDYTDESLTGSLGRIFQTLKRSHTLMSQPGYDIKPIPKAELVPEYLEKIKDSELGFRKEFEMLPEKFSDRTTKGSEMSENAHKNRYPDIKSYDQTRVKLNEISAANYINANYVMGYKERKKFICAQGPMEATVNDFWRMIVEQHCSLCIMLTNLEESGKMKCVQYWPEAGQPKQFGNITVRLVKEKPYADYLVRTLRAEWKVESTEHKPDSKDTDGLMSNGSGTLKSLSSCSNYNSLSSTSSQDEIKFHEVQQYHYLMWKDFVAPEHPVGILSFLRRINEAYSPDMGPLLVHCSAGVGRTGTLVALDGLVTELEEENLASIYNFICDLRHQRNFLVQSLKQYVFIHRALMEYAQFGNTEKTVGALKDIWKNHQQKSIGEPSELEQEFERLGKVIEDRKAFTVANNESNKSKNRYDFILPYDNNCVILQPLPTQIGATYINASFMQGFDLGENFIVTQDPLATTKCDFWRMVYEQGVNTIVMLSEMGSGEDCCSPYWPDDEDIYDYITVKFVASESYPKYNTRTFTVINTKSENSVNVTQFQYVGWSGLMGEVPLVTQGIVEIITRVQGHVDTNMGAITHTIVHCSGGGDRSSLYVTLSNCLRQQRREGCVDIFQITRKVKAQRQHQIQLFSQYEFIYKSLVEQIDLNRDAAI